MKRWYQYILSLKELMKRGTVSLVQINNLFCECSLFSVYFIEIYKTSFSNFDTVKSSVHCRLNP